MFTTLPSRLLRSPSNRINSRLFTSLYRNSTSQRLSRFPLGQRGFSTTSEEKKRANTRVLMYSLSLMFGALGLGFAAVPLYRVFCQVTGFNGTVQEQVQESKLKKIQNLKEDEEYQKKKRPLTIEFDSSTPKAMPWTFYPLQKRIEVYPGESALVFYRAKNNANRPVTGVATYNVTPILMGLYFNKIQCFCFEEQRLEPGEEIDMPILFFVDPDMLDDAYMDKVHRVVLSYTFYEVAEEEGEFESITPSVESKE